jgi:hypothetical protein
VKAALCLIASAQCVPIVASRFPSNDLKTIQNRVLNREDSNAMKLKRIYQGRITEMAIAILEATCDGDKLSPSDLKLVELSVNGMLDSDGIVRFQQLHENATKPEGYTVAIGSVSST